MSQQTHGMPELKYSEEAFREMYEALKFIVDNFNTADVEGFMRAVNKGIPKAQKALAKAEGKNDSI